MQEFKVVGDKLEFTGFAIASGKKAYNRVNVSASNIERVGNKIAYLESNRFNLITIESNIYAKENYNDYFASDLGGTMPNAFALGLENVLLSYNQGTTSSILKILNLRKTKKSHACRYLYRRWTHHPFITSGSRKLAGSFSAGLLRKCT